MFSKKSSLQSEDSKPSSGPFIKPTVQQKLEMGQANDKYEQEADRVADKVVNHSKGDTIQKKDVEEELQQKPIANEITPLVQKMESTEEEPVQKMEEDEGVQRMEEEEPVQKKEEEEAVQAKKLKQPKSATKASSSFESRLNSKKGSGNQMDASTKSRMEGAFGTTFNNVNIHNDSEAASMSSEVNAQAFAHGKDVFFNKNKYNPGTQEGDMLLAHELTHTIQQEGAESEDKASNSSALETDVEQANIGLFAKLFQKGQKLSKNVLPRLKSGLKISKCTSDKSEAMKKYIEKRKSPPAGIPAPNSSIKDAAVWVGESNDKMMDSYTRFQDKEVGPAGLIWGFFFSRTNGLNGATSKPKKFDNWGDFDKMSGNQKSALFQISRITGIVKHNGYSKKKSILSKLQKAYNYWPSSYKAVFQSGKSADSNTCNVFLGETMFKAGIDFRNSGKFWSAGQVYSGAQGNLVEIDKAYAMPGDIAGYGPHVAVIVTVDPATKTFITREGYQADKGGERVRNFDELLGLEKSLKVFRRK